MKHFFSNIKKFADKEFDPRKYFILLCGIFAGICALSALVIFLLDPYVYYHKHWIVKPLYNRSYAMVPGLLRHEDYDTVLFGSSIAQNFVLSDLDALYNGKSIKATSPGLPAEALGKYLSVAIKKSTFRHAVISVDFSAYAKLPKDSPRLQYDYLYGDALLPPKYLFSSDSINSAFKLVRGNVKQLFTEKQVKDMDRNYMFGLYKKSSKARLHAAVRESKSRNRFVPAILPQSADYMEKYLFSHIRNNPDLTFDLFLPPYHVYYWCALKYKGRLEAYFTLREHFIAKAVKFPNVKIHDFQAAEDIVCNMDIYRDETHYDKETNALMAREMKKGRYLINEAEGKKNTLKLRKLVEQHHADYLAL